MRNNLLAKLVTLCLNDRVLGEQPYSHTGGVRSVLCEGGLGHQLFRERRGQFKRHKKLRFRVSQMMPSSRMHCSQRLITKVMCSYVSPVKETYGVQWRRIDWEDWGKCNAFQVFYNVKGSPGTPVTLTTLPWHGAEGATGGSAGADRLTLRYKGIRAAVWATRIVQGFVFPALPWTVAIQPPCNAATSKGPAPLCFIFWAFGHIWDSCSRRENVSQKSNWTKVVDSPTAPKVIPMIENSWIMPAVCPYCTSWTPPPRDRSIVERVRQREVLTPCCHYARFNLPSAKLTKCCANNNQVGQLSDNCQSYLHFSPHLCSFFGETSLPMWAPKLAPELNWNWN